jgi:uncharacterized protein (TIGR02466 family)
MTAPAWQANIVNLWPSLLLRCNLPGHEQHNGALIELIERMDRDAKQMTANYRDVDFFALQHPPIAWLRGAIDAAIQSYLDAVGVTYAVRWNTRGWANINRRGDYHSPHNHGWSYLSGTYYARVPPQPAPHGAGSASAAPAAAISHYDPRGALNMLAVGGEALSQREHRESPKAGDMLLWNSFINHSVHPNLATTTRISISFNIALAWSDEQTSQ